MKRTPLRKRSKSKTAILKRKLWVVFSRYIRQRDQAGGCFICKARATGSNYHASHFIPKSVGGLILYFHPMNVHGCCMRCNIHLGGNLWEYGQKLGEAKVKELYLLKRKIVKWSEKDYEEKIKLYEQKLCHLESIKEHQNGIKNANFSSKGKETNKTTT